MKAPVRWLLMTMAASLAMTAWASPSVKLVASPFQRPGPGNDVVVAVEASQLNGVSSFDLAYTFDRSVLTPRGVFLTDWTHGSVLTWSFTTPGVVQIHLDRPAALYGSGDIAWVTFRVAADAAPASTTPLSWVSASLNGGASPCALNGMGLVVGSAPATIAMSQGSFGSQGSAVVIPVSARSLAGGSSYDLVVTFDPNVLAAFTVERTKFTRCMSLEWNVSVPGTVRVSLFGMCSLSGSGRLVNIVFTVVGANGARTPLNVTRGAIDEERYPSVLEDGLFNVCGIPDADGDGYSACAGDCNDANAATHPGALETCNGLDDDCSGIVDDAVPPAGAPEIGAAKLSGNTLLSWPPVPAATNYDVIRGDLVALSSTTGDFSQSTDLCLANDSPASTAIDGAIPAEGEGFWYLVRPANCAGPGSFDGRDGGQVAPRDPGIDASASSCP